LPYLVRLRFNVPVSPLFLSSDLFHDKFNCETSECATFSLYASFIVQFNLDNVSPNLKSPEILFISVSFP